MSASKNILIIPGMTPYPPNDGGKLCIFCLIDYLRKYNKIQLLLLVYERNDIINIDRLKKLWPDVVIHYVDAIPNDDLINKKQQTLRVVKNRLRQLYKLIMAEKGNNSSDPYRKYEPSRTMPFFPQPLSFIEKLESIIASNNFDIIQVETIDFINLVNIFPAEVKKVFVQLEGRADILYDYGVSHNLSRTYVKYIVGNASFMEHAYMSQYDAVLALCEPDSIKIQKLVSPGVKVYTSPFGLLDKDLDATKLDIDNYIPENLIFIGGEGHYPNLDGLTWFVTDVVKEFKTKPFNKIYVSGNWSEGTRNNLKQFNSSLEFIGFVDDLTPYLKNSISIVPIRIGGGGIRTKILFSMGNGSPVITTSLAAVGIMGVHQKELIITDTAINFADAINNLFNDVNLNRYLIKNAFQLVLKKYSQSKVGDIRNKIYQDITLNEEASQ
jgi:glycosyltransferase involved in cell wall biosynthesis